MLPNGDDRIERRSAQRSNDVINMLPALMSFVLIVAATALVCIAISSEQQRRIETEFARDTQRIVVRVQSQLNSHFEALLGVKGLFAAKDTVNRLDFQLFLEELNLKNSHPGFQAIQFVRYVPDDQLAQFVAAVRNDRTLRSGGYPDFDVHPGGSRPSHYVIEFTEPMQGNEKAFGFDLASLPVHLEALELGRDTGQAIATERVNLIQDSKASPAIVVRLPLYGNYQPLNSPASRRAALLGFAALVYRIDDLMREVIDPQLLTSMQTRIYDMGYDGAPSAKAHGSANLLFDSSTKSAGESPDAGGWLNRVPPTAHGSLVIGMRAWAFDFDAKPGGRYSRDYSLIGAIMLSGVVIAALFSTLVAAWVRRRVLSARLARTVAEQKAIFDNATVGIQFLKNRVILTCNLGMTELLGYGRDELVGSSTRKLFATQEEWDNIGVVAYEAMQSGHSWIGEVHWVRKDGRSIVCRLHGKYVDPANLDLGSIWVSYDITAQKDADAALLEANVKLQAGLTRLSMAYAAEEQARQQATLALEDLKTAQGHLVQSEKMATLGQLVASVAHEINTPIAAVKSSGENIADALMQLNGSTQDFVELDHPTRSLFARLTSHDKHRNVLMSSREERAIVREVAQQLADAGIENAKAKASLLVQLNAQGSAMEYLPLFRHPNSDLLMTRAYCLATLFNSSSNINTAVERVTKIVFALKAYSRVDSSGEMVAADLHKGVDTVLTIYHSQIKKGVELVRNFEDLPPLVCLPDELNQVWTNLIHNALQAMDYNGTLTVSIRRQGEEAVVSVGDTGCGIPEAIREKIFEPFFTTKPTGEGSGLGLDIVRKIVDKHKGRIEVLSTVGVGTTFVVYLPYPTMLDSA